MRVQALLRVRSAAIGFSPFAIESVENPAETTLAQGYALLGIAPLILEYQGKGAAVELLAETAEQRAAAGVQNQATF